MKIRIVSSIADITRIVILRFAPLPRAWAIVVIIVNALALCFIESVYAQVALVAVGVGILIMSLIYARLGFVRLLGIGHVLWIPMLPWLCTQLPRVDHGTWLYVWLLCLLMINSMCLIVDAIDVTRFVAGERSPHYVWSPSQPTDDDDNES